MIRIIFKSFLVAVFALEVGSAAAESSLSLQPLISNTTTTTALAGNQSGFGVGFVWERPSTWPEIDWKLSASYSPNQHQQSFTNSTKNYSDAFTLKRTVATISATWKFSFSDILYLSLGGGLKNIALNLSGLRSGSEARVSSTKQNISILGINSSLESDFIFSKKFFVGIEWFGIFTPAYSQQASFSHTSTSPSHPDDLKALENDFNRTTYATNFVVFSPRVGYVF